MSTLSEAVRCQWISPTSRELISIRNKYLVTPRIKPGAAGCEARTQSIVLCGPPLLNIFSLWLFFTERRSQISRATVATPLSKQMTSSSSDKHLAGDVDPFLQMQFRGRTSPFFLSQSRAQALSVEPGRAWACQIFPQACFEPKLFTYKNYKIQAQAWLEVFRK